MTIDEKISTLKNSLAAIEEVLVPRSVKEGKGHKRMVQPSYTKKVITIVSLKTTTGRFLPVSHEGFSTDTYVDKVDLLGTTRAEFISRKQKGIERRAHMSIFRELMEKEQVMGSWEEAFKKYFDKACFLPGDLCLACWNCSLFGGLEAGKGGAFSRIRHFDTYSLEPAEVAIAMEGSDEGLAIGNTVGEDLARKREADSYHQYEYVKAGINFPVLTIIENPTLLDVVGYLRAVRLADQHGYGKYSANHGKFSTEFLAVSTGYPCFSVLDMLSWAGPEGDAEVVREKFQPTRPGVEFETTTGEPVVLWGEELLPILDLLAEEFHHYAVSLGE